MLFVVVNLMAGTKKFFVNCEILVEDWDYGQDIFKQSFTIFDQSSLFNVCIFWYIL